MFKSVHGQVLIHLSELRHRGEREQDWECQLLYMCSGRVNGTALETSTQKWWIIM